MAATIVLAPEARRMGLKLINQHHKHLTNATILYLFSDQKATKSGRPVMAKTKKLSPLEKFLGQSFSEGDDAGADYVILFYAEEWGKLTPAQRLALVDHELCLPAGVVVTGPQVQGSLSRWYTGEMIEIRTAAGYLLSGTPNHPVLTDSGWVPLGFLKEGGYVVSCANPERVAAAMDPDEYQVPTFIEQVARSLNMVPRLVPQATHDLNPYIVDRDVDVVAANGLLRSADVAQSLKGLSEFGLGRRDAGQVLLSGAGKRSNRLVAMPFAAPRVMRRTSVLPSGVGVGLGAHALAVASVPNGNTGLSEEAHDRLITHPEYLRKRIEGSTTGVALDQIVQVNASYFSGHVYNLQTSQGWYIGNHIVTHNCHMTVEYDEKTDEPSWGLQGHDLEEFRAVVQRHGLWQPDVEEFAATVQQLSLQLELVQ